MHFAPECFTRRPDLADSNKSISGSRHLERGSIPSIDVAVEQQEKPETDREQRMVNSCFFGRNDAKGFPAM